MTTVFTLDPAFFVGATKRALGGWAKTAGDVRPIRYGAIPMPMFVRKGVRLLNKALTTTPGPKYVLGWSEGAQIIAKWLREHGPDSEVNPADVVFILLGNPERFYGGACVVPSPPRKMGGLIKPKPSYGGCGFPADTRYRVVDLCRQYEGWADVPTVEEPSKVSLKNVDDGLHMNYFGVSLEDPDLLLHTEGNVTYGMWPTKLRHENDRAAIEADYQRPPYTPGTLSL